MRIDLTALAYRSNSGGLLQDDDLQAIATTRDCAGEASEASTDDDHLEHDTEASFGQVKQFAVVKILQSLRRSVIRDKTNWITECIWPGVSLYEEAIQWTRWFVFFIRNFRAQG